MPISSAASAEIFGRDAELATTFADNKWSLNSAISWGAVLAGAVAAASVSLILLILGVGLGLSSVSPWARDGVSATTFGVSTIVWLTLTQLLASAMGGYLAGRLRTRWTGAHADEVYFRDTAHGFLAWAVSTLATAVLLGSVIGSIIHGGAQAGASMVGATADTASSAVVSAVTRRAQGPDAGPMGYLIDSLFRRDGATATPANASATSAVGSDASERAAIRDAAEVSRIIMNASLSQPLSPEDLRYISQMVSLRTGLSPQEAEKRVNEVVAKAQAQLRDAEVATRNAADKARKASAYSALWLFVSLLVGAFVASLAATFGGRLRDA